MKNRMKSKERSFVLVAFGAIPFIALIKGFWPDVIPFEIFGFLRPRGNFLGWLRASWPLFCWGASVSILSGLAQRYFFPLSTPRRSISGGKALVLGLLVSVWAGFAEEVCFRWIIFLSNIAVVKIGNYLIFGWAGFGLAQWLHLSVVGPIADFMTLRHLHTWLFDRGWAVGAALLATNALFRDGHKYLGLVGIVNSWFLGMYFFWILFTFGLWPAIVVHFLYDAIIFTIVAVVGRQPFDALPHSRLPRRI
jgi:hypothetical protein